MQKYLILNFFGIILLTVSCSTTNNNEMAVAIPAPPQSLNAPLGKINIVDDDASPASSSNTSNVESATRPESESSQRHIEEDRSIGGTITQIKVENKGNLPNYYINPSLQQDLNLNSAPNKSVATPSWQINW